MSEINQKELQEFLEWCGWTNNGCYWFEPIEFGGNRYAPYGDQYNQIPPIDLNNLFKYAVPKIIEKNCYIQLNTNNLWICEIWEREVIGRNATHIAEAETPTQALYQAIQKARKG